MSFKRLIPICVAAAIAAILCALYGVGFAVAHADPVGGAPPAATGIDWQTTIATVGIVLVGLGAILGYVSAGLHWLAPRTQTTIDDRARDDVDAIRADIAKLSGVVASLGAITFPPRPPQAGHARLVVMMLIAITAGICVVGCAATKAEVIAVANGAVTCSKADLPAARALGLQLGTEALAGALTGGVPWAQLEAEAEAAAKVQGIAVAACAFGPLLADLAKLLGVSTSARASVAVAAVPVDPLADGRAALARFKAAMGVTEIQLTSGRVM